MCVTVAKNTELFEKYGAMGRDHNLQPNWCLLADEVKRTRKDSLEGRSDVSSLKQFFSMLYFWSIIRYFCPFSALFLFLIF